MVATQTLANTALLVLAVEMVIFTFTYAAGSPWWATPLGKIYIAKTVLLTLVLVQNTASALTSADYPGRHQIRLSIYAGGAIAMMLLWVMLRRYQREGKRSRAAAGDTRRQRQVWADAIRDWRRHRKG